jgi:HlyD family secretion protein
MHEFDTDLAQTAHSVRRLMRSFALVSGLLVFGVGGWAATAQVESAVIANGKFVVKSNAQAVQHLEGGIVGAILVAEGEDVKKGQVLVRLDSSKVEADLAIVKGRLIDLAIEKARLVAERDGKAVLQRPKPPFDLSKERAAFNASMSLQQTLLTARMSAIRFQLSQLTERNRQTKDQIQGFKRVRRARVTELEQSTEDLTAQQWLDKKRLIRKSVLRQTIRQVARSRGEIGDIDAKISGSRSRLVETKYRIAELKRTERSKILDQLKANQSQLQEAEEKYAAALDRTTSLEIRAPRAGLIHEMQIFTVGGVIKAGQKVMSVIPKNELLLVSAKIQTHEIDQVYIGQKALVRISAFKQRITPELEATVTGISPDETKDEKSGQSFFKAKITIKPTEKAKLGKKQLTPGLPAEVFIKGKKRRVITYLTQPLVDQMALTFREE